MPVSGDCCPMALASNPLPTCFSSRHPLEADIHFGGSTWVPQVLEVAWWWVSMCRTAGSACGSTRTSSQGRCLSQLAKLRPPPSPPKQDEWVTSAPSPGAQDYTKSRKTTGAPSLFSVALGLRLGFIATPIFTPPSPDVTLRPTRVPPDLLARRLFSRRS